MKVEEQKADALLHKAEGVAEKLIETAGDTAYFLKDGKVVKIFEEHLKEDSDFQTDAYKKFEELTTLMRDNGSHLSYFNKNLVEVKAMLVEQNRAAVIQNDVMTKHINRVEPMLLKYEDDVTFFKGAKRRSGWLIGGALGLSAVSGAWYLIKNFITNLK